MVAKITTGSQSRLVLEVNRRGRLVIYRPITLKLARQAGAAGLLRLDELREPEPRDARARACDHALPPPLAIAWAVEA